VLRTLPARLLRLVPVLLLVSLGTALLLDLVPGDPAVALLGETATPAQILRVRAELRLDDPLLLRYAKWLGDVVQGDFGSSLRTGQPVTQAITDRLPVTAELTLLAVLMALAVAVPLGIYTALHADGRADRAVNLVNGAFIASPAFLTGLLLSYLLAVKAGAFPTTGWVRLSEDPGGNLRSAFLPALTLALAEVAVFARLLRADMIAVLQEDYILNARARGLPTRYILFRHALRPSSFSLLTVFGLSLGRLVSGAVIVEVLFALPGLGQLLVQAILSRDFLVVQGLVLFIALVYVVINTLVDVAYELVDPRVRERTRT
jgi:peptide/nickel transport system permease protein